MHFRLSASIVIFESDPALLQRTIDALAAAIGDATTAGLIGDATVTLVDNDAAPSGAPTIRREFDPGIPARKRAPATRWGRIAGHGNVGFGRGHNLVLRDPDAIGDFHLVLNPDAPLAVDALTIGLRWMRDTADCAMAAPNARSVDGTPLFLCKRYPDALTLLLRAAAPTALRRHFAARLARYELRDVVGESGQLPAPDVMLASGCCMLLRREPLAATGGFDPRFFVYFEDYDLSLRITGGGRWHIDYLPDMLLVHFGGHAAKKSWAHIRMFAGGAFRFFNKHGWKLV